MTAEVLYAYNAPAACEWPECGHEPAVCEELGRTPWYCWCHATDDFLPALRPGLKGVCVQCHAYSVWWLVRWPQAEDICLHLHCRRRWVLNGSSAEPPAPVEARGAYARRVR